MEPQALTLNRSPRHGGGIPLHAGHQRRSLLLWSGGVDSTYALVRLLRTTRDHVFTHHVCFAGPGSDRCSFELAAIEQLRECLEHRERHFTHTNSRIDLSELSSRGADSSILTFMAAQAAMAHALTPFDRILFGVNGDRDPGWNPDSAACALRRSRMAQALRAAWGCDEVPQIYLWLPRPCRAQMNTTLGPVLLALTVSCMQPVRESATVLRKTDLAQSAGPSLAVGRSHEESLRACGRCAKCCQQLPVSAADGARSGGKDKELSDAAAYGAEVRTPHLFHHLERLLNKKRELQHEAASSDPLAP